MDKTDRLRDYGLAFLLYEQGLGICGYELIRELFIFIKLILNSYLVPILNGEVSLPDVGADWIFIDLALCKIVNPSNFHKLKQIILSHVRKMYMCKEPNILDYYDNLEDILQYLEYTQL